MTQHTNNNFLIGIISIAKLDNNYKNEIELLSNFCNESTSKVTKEIFNNLFEKEFYLEEAQKTFDSETKQLFFNLSIMIALLDDLSEKEENLIREYSNKLNFPQEEITKIIELQKKELSKNLDFTPYYWFSRFLKGYINYIKTGITKFDCYYSFRLLHFLTNNRINKLIGIIAQIFNRFDENILSKQILGNDLNSAVKSLKENGYFVFKEKIPEKIINNLLEITEKSKCYPLSSQKMFSENFENDGVIFKDTEYISTRYEYYLPDLLNTPCIFKLLELVNFTDLSRKFFNSKSLLSVLHLWGTTPIKDPMDRYTGQVFHIDIDRPETLLILIYLSDVNEDNGPHIYVKDSHKSKPFNLLEDRRMTVEDINNNYPKESIIEIHGQKGTVIAIDPIGFHRGKPLNIGNRFALKYEFSTDGFGEMLPQMNIRSEEAKSIVMGLKDKYEYTFSKFNLV